MTRENWSDRLARLVRRGVTAYMLIREASERRYRSLGEERDLDRQGLTADQDAALAFIGIRNVRRLTHLEQILEAAGFMTREELAVLPTGTVDDQHETTDLIYEAWLREVGSDLVEERRLRCYSNGTRVPDISRMHGGRAIAPAFTSIVRFNDVVHVIHFESPESRGGEVFWSVYVRGPAYRAILGILQRRVETALSERLRGRVLNHHLTPIELKSYDEGDLVYPDGVREKIDRLCRAFTSWSQPDSPVKRWGALLVGRPGTGKTTIGGLLAARRPRNCTFLYVPAAELQYASQLTAVFEAARRFEPVIVQIDDADLISGDRRGPNAKYTPTFMECLDGLVGSGRIFVLLTTNTTAGMDPAILERAGRISNQITFEGFGDVFDQLLAVHARMTGLAIDRETISAAVLAKSDLVKDMTPDEAKNICERLSLEPRTGLVSFDELVAAIEETHRTFHLAVKQDFLPPMPRQPSSDAQGSTFFD